MVGATESKRFLTSALHPTKWLRASLHASRSLNNSACTLSIPLFGTPPHSSGGVHWLVHGRSCRIVVFHTARQATKHAFQMLASAMKNSEGKTFHWAARQPSTPAALRSDTGEQARMLDGTTNKGPVVNSPNNPHQAQAPCRSRQTFCQDPACI